MLAQYGWLKVIGDVDPAFSEKHQGHVYVSKKDITMGHLAAGDSVTFYLYVDGQGLGAEVCKKQATRNEFARDSWKPTSLSTKSCAFVPQPQQSDKCTFVGRQPHFSPQSQQAVYYMPFGAVSGTVMPQYEGGPFQSMDEICSTSKVDQGKVEPADDCLVLDGELPSVGSVGHSDGSCKRCAFFPKGRCQNGKECAHCHFDHTSRLRLRKRKQARASSKYNNTQDPWRSPQEGDGEEIEVVHDIDKQDFTDDIATIAPSSSPSDDEERTIAPSSPSLAEVSDSESSLSNGSALEFRLDDDQTDSSQSNSPRAEPHKCDGFSPSPTSWSAQQRIRKVAALKEVSTVEFHLDSDQTNSSLNSSPRAEPHKCDGLSPSPTSWSAQQRIRKGSASKAASTIEIARTARALLNKLTHERFEALCGQILELPLSTSEHLTALAAEIFEIATTQDGFRSMYTELCVRLDVHLSEKRSAIGGKAFRKALVSSCQTTFERNLQPADPVSFTGLTDEERFELEMKLKTRRLGNMRFIGELLVRGLLAQKLMPPIILELLHGDEAALESLIALVTIVAPFFEQKASLYQATLRDTLATLRRKQTDKGISSRVRCHLSDLFDFQARGWVVRSA